MESTLRRTWAEIDLDALKYNYETIRSKIGPGVKFLGVVKADAYGHGAVQVSKTLQEAGADYLAVSSIDEGMELRLHDITIPILILGHTPKEQVENLIRYDITQAVSCASRSTELCSPKISTSDPTSTDGIPVISIMDISIQILPRCGAAPSLVNNATRLERHRKKPSAYPYGTTPIRVVPSVV